MQLILNLKILERTESKPFELFYRGLFNSFTNFDNIEEYLNIVTAIEKRLQKLIESMNVVWPEDSGVKEK